MPVRAISLIAVLLAAILVGCSGSSGSDAEPAAETSTQAAGPAPGVESAEVALEEGRTVIDVRTPEEFDAGHVEGADLRDVQDPGFDDALDELDPEGAYVVYCRSGNRSAAAAERMRAVGLDVVDGGSLEDMIEAGWPPSS